MPKIATISTRIEPELKVKAEAILEKISLTSAEAIRLFYKQICLQRGLPFEVKMLNKATLQAMCEVERGKTHKTKSVGALFAELK